MDVSLVYPKGSRDDGPVLETDPHMEVENQRKGFVEESSLVRLPVDVHVQAPCAFFAGWTTDLSSSITPCTRT